MKTLENLRRGYIERHWRGRCFTIRISCLIIPYYTNRYTQLFLVFFNAQVNWIKSYTRYYVIRYIDNDYMTTSMWQQQQQQNIKSNNNNNEDDGDEDDRTMTRTGETIAPSLICYLFIYFFFSISSLSIFLSFLLYSTRKMCNVTVILKK